MNVITGLESVFMTMPAQSVLQDGPENFMAGIKLAETGRRKRRTANAAGHQRRKGAAMRGGIFGASHQHVSASNAHPGSTRRCCRCRHARHLQPRRLKSVSKDYVNKRLRVIYKKQPSFPLLPTAKSPGLRC